MKPDILVHKVRRRPGGGAYVLRTDAAKLLAAGRIVDADIQEMSHGVVYLKAIDLIPPPKLARVQRDAE